METIIKIYTLVAIIYACYFIISYKYNLIKINSLIDVLISFKAFKLIIIKHLLGILLFGIVFWMYQPEFQFLIINSGFNNATFIVLLLIFIIISGFVSRLSAINYFENLDIWSVIKPSNQFLYFSIRIPFLFFYEFYFRGVLLHSSLLYTNLLGAILINLILYTLIHSFNSRKEIIGCLPFGIVLSLFSYYTNSIWPAFLIHTTLSFMYESTLFKITSFKTQKS